MKTEAVAINVREAAERLGLGYVKCYQLITSAQLRSIRVGTRRLVPVSALQEFIEKKLAEQSDDHN